MEIDPIFSKSLTYTKKLSEIIVKVVKTYRPHTQIAHKTTNTLRITFTELKYKIPNSWQKGIKIQALKPNSTYSTSSTWPTGNGKPLANVRKGCVRTQVAECYRTINLYSSPSRDDITKKRVVIWTQLLWQKNRKDKEQIYLLRE